MIARAVADDGAAASLQREQERGLADAGAACDHDSRHAVMACVLPRPDVVRNLIEIGCRALFGVAIDDDLRHHQQQQPCGIAFTAFPGGEWIAACVGPSKRLGASGDKERGSANQAGGGGPHDSRVRHHSATGMAKRS
jgi:hypothetical protein